MREKRISVLMHSKIKKLEGVSRLESLIFVKDSKTETKDERDIDYYIRPDVVIAENGLGEPKYKLANMLTPSSNSETGEPPISIGIDHRGIPSSNIKFSLHYNDIHSPIFAAGSCT